MIDEKIIQALKAKYSALPPLLFRRSVERAASAGELFDILDTVPAWPVAWDEAARRWAKVDPLLAKKGQKSATL